MPLLSSAQQPAQPSAQSAPPPPQTQPLTEDEAPAITIRKPGVSEETITQQTKQGKVTDVKVQTGSSTYHLKPNDQAGSALPGDVESSPMRGSQWKVLEFDMNKNKEKPASPTPQRLAPASPSKATPAAK
ncbi:MAG: DUF2782 domain-containing protein [Herbaspirillum sp.]